MPNRKDERRSEQDFVQPQYYGEEKDYDEISLKDLIMPLWRFRSAIATLSLAVLLLISVAAAWMYLGRQKDHVTKVAFKVEEYPADPVINPADILTTPVLDKVYKDNHLQAFLGYPDFKSALSVIQSNDQVRFLEYEYAAKLSQKKLRSEDRDRLEKEFLVKKKEAQGANYTLSLAGDEEVSAIPVHLRAKVLKDILRIWADRMYRKGVRPYDLDLVSKNTISRAALEEVDYLVATDILRSTLERIAKNIQKVGEIPGAKNIKLQPHKVSLSDLEYRVADLERFVVSPLFGLIHQTGLAKDKQLTLGYLENKIFDIELDLQEVSANMDLYESSLKRYVQKKSRPLATRGAERAPARSTFPPQSGNVPAMIPQFGASFLESLMQMAEQSTDTVFQQDITKEIIEEGLKKSAMEFEHKYYLRSIDSLRKTAGMENSTKRFVTLVQERVRMGHQKVFQEATKTIEELNAIYESVNQTNLNPETLYYTVTEPVQTLTFSKLTPKRTLLFMIMALFLAEGAILLGVLIANNLRKQP